MLQSDGVGTCENFDKIEAYSLAVENISTTNVRIKVVSRVTLVSNTGLRILDTLVKPDDLPDGENMVIKEGMKTELMKLGQEKGPTLEMVRELITDLVKGKKVIGYHLPDKLNNLGMAK